MLILDVMGMLSLTLCCYAAVPSDQAQCGKPPKIENALLNSDWDVETFPPGYTAIYSCHPGYSSLGRIRMACVEGKWHELSKGQCKKKSCGHPGDIPFGTFELKDGYEFVFGAEVVYTCDEGYQMVSRHNSRICAADGWTNYPPHCEARLCPPVMDDSVRVITSLADDEYSMGHIISFKCKNPNQTLKGPSQIYCTEDGTWNVDPPTCKESCFIQETDMRNNNIHLKNNQGLHVKHNMDVHFECSYGYNILDPGKLTIQCNNGVLEYPTCQKIAMKPCGRPPQIQHGEITEPVNDTYDSGSSVTYKCQKLFTAHGQKIIQCQDGIWGEPPVCLTMKPCGRPPQIQHGEITELVNDTNDSGSSVTYKCQQFFTTYGQNVSQCQDGIWGEPPVCLAMKPCGRPPQILHGDITGHMNKTYNSGSSVTYKCQYLFTAHGQNMIQCRDGIWGEPPVCLAMRPCGRPPQILHGDITGHMNKTYKSGSSVTYKCQYLFTAHGQKMIQCRDGIWGEPPVCLEPCTIDEKHMHENYITLIWKNVDKNHCTRSVHNRNYAKKCYVKHNGTIQFACLPGYRIYDQMALESKCNKGNLPYPRCLESRKPCGRPPQILHGDITEHKEDTYDSGSSVTYKCQQLFTAHGQEMIQCQDGIWGEPPDCLEPCTTGGKHMYENHITLSWKNVDKNRCTRSVHNRNYAKKCYVKHNEAIQFACLPGYRIYNQMALKRKCHRGNLAYPRCLKVY